MTSFDHLTLSVSVHHLVQHVGNPETTIVAGERYVTREPESPATERMAPDLLIAFSADPGAYRDSNGCIISVQGPPRLRHGDSLPTHRQAGRSAEEGPLCRPRFPRVLAVRRNRRVPRDNARRRPVGGQPIRAHPNRDGRGRGPAGLQHRAQSLHPVGARRAGLARPEDREHIVRYEDLEARVRELEQELQRRRQS